MADEPEIQTQHVAQQRFGGTFQEFMETFKMSGERPKNEVDQDMALIDDLLADQKKEQEKGK